MSGGILLLSESTADPGIELDSALLPYHPAD
jgi:hypothetical protein